VSLLAVQPLVFLTGISAAGKPTVAALLARRFAPGGVMELDRALREETPRIGLWPDTSYHRPDDTIDEIVERGLSKGQIE